MSNPDLIFEDSETVSSSTYNPIREYDTFVAGHREHLTINNCKIFFIRAAKAKAELKKKNQEKVKIAFGTLVVEVVNNHRPGGAQSVVQDSDLTLHRLSGYLARYMLLAAKTNAAAREAAVMTLINPISAKMGISWSAGLEIYLSTLPGTEMFLDDFKLFPLAFILIRIKRGEIPEALAKKALRQRYDGKEASTWMVEDIESVKLAMKKVESIKPTFTGLTATIAKFLEEIGIRK